MNITTIGIDLAKSVLQIHGVDAEGNVVLKKKLRRGTGNDASLAPVVARADVNSRPGC